MKLNNYFHYLHYFLMILTPGVAITNSLRDIMGSDHISGMARMLEAVSYTHL